MKSLLIALIFCLFSSQVCCAWSFGEPLHTEQAGWFQFVEGACFEQGSRHPLLETENEKPPKWVCVPSFYLGRTEVTQGQFQAVMGYNPSNNPAGPDYPVEELSYIEATRFVARLNATDKNLPKGWKYRLPTEAEWEYAAGSGKGGKRTEYPGTSNSRILNRYGWLNGGSTHPVARKKPTALGLYDMAGNVLEMVSDLYLAKPGDSRTSGSSVPCRVVKGSAVSAGEPFYARTSIRTCQEETDATSLTGFRLAIEISK